MKLQFTKMHGLGNDFMVIDQITQNVQISSEQVARLADRHRGIGFDQLLIVSPPSSPDVDFRYRIFNADGSEVEQCGNGARCFARFVREKRLTNKHRIVVETLSGIIELRVNEKEEITVDMGAPIFDPVRIPLLADQPRDPYVFDVDGQAVELGCVSMGNPHGVLIVDNVDTAPVENLGPALEKHTNFPKRANIGFMQIVDRQRVRLRVFERGAGETQACGTGACAAAVIALRRNLVDSPVTVQLPGGTLSIQWQGEGQPVLMTGPATTVFEGTITL
jgi:diaminopimelate epimerase